MKLKAILIILATFGSLALLIGLNIALHHPNPQFTLDVAKLDVLEVPVQYRSPEALQTGKLLFLTSCAKCHGNYGEGSLQAPCLTDSTWRHGRGHFGDVAQVVRFGVPGTTMIGWDGRMQPQDLDALAAYVTVLQTHPKLK